MAILNFSDVLKNVGLDPKDVKLIRHALSDERFRECYKAGRVSLYARNNCKRKDRAAGRRSSEQLPAASL